MTMKPKIFTWIPVGVAAALVACAVPGPVPQDTESVAVQALVGVDWVAIAIDGVVPVVSPEPRLRWSSGERVQGSGGCNGFVGTTIFQPGVVRFGSLAAQGRSCITAPAGQEDMFFKALEQTRNVQMEKNELLLLDHTGKVLTRLARAKLQP